MGKRITELQLRDNVDDDVNFPVDDGTQTYRVTAPQLVDYILPPGAITATELDTSAVTTAKIAASAVTSAKLDAGVLASIFNNVPTVQRFTATGTQTGWLFTISTSSNVAVGDTYTNNSNTFTVEGALTAQSGQVLFMSGTGSTSGTTLTRATGSGTSSITFSVKVATAHYTVPSTAPVYLRFRVVGAGAGGGGSGTSGNNGSVGTTSAFGANIGTCFGGTGGGGGTSSLEGAGGAGGGYTFGATASILKIMGISGQAGLAAPVAAAFGNNATVCISGSGGGSHLSKGATGIKITIGVDGFANTGEGGGGGGGAGGVCYPAGGGGAGGYVEGLIMSPVANATYPYVIGTGGAGGTSGSHNGGAGAAGLIVVEEYYQ